MVAYESNSVTPLYAAIDLGSNSFHMLVVRHIDGSVQTMAGLSASAFSCRLK